MEILEQLSSLDIKNLAKDERLLEEYNLIINDIKKQGVANLLGYDTGTLFVPTTKTIQFWKFISGASLLWILALLVPVMNTLDKRSDKIAAFFIMLICGAITGWISYTIPTFYNPIINYLSVPVLLVAILVIALMKSNKKRTKR